MDDTAPGYSGTTTDVEPRTSVTDVSFNGTTADTGLPVAEAVAETVAELVGVAESVAVAEAVAVGVVEDVGVAVAESVDVAVIAI